MDNGHFPLMPDELQSLMSFYTNLCFFYMSTLDAMYTFIVQLFNIYIKKFDTSMLKHNVNVRDDNGRRHVETTFSFRTILLSKKFVKK